MISLWLQPKVDRLNLCKTKDEKLNLIYQWVHQDEIDVRTFKTLLDLV